MIMKNLKLLFASILLISAFAFNSCTPNKDFTPPTDEVLTHNNWSIDYFYKTKDLTPDYSGYSFLFSSTGAVVMEKQNETNLGTWSISADQNNSEIISINFNTTDDNISKFNQQWKVTGKTSSLLQFEGNAGSSQLRIRH